MDVKSAFQYGTIKEEVYVCQPSGFEDLDYPDKVYKVVRALYGLHQAPTAWYVTLANYLLENGFQRGKIDQTLFIKRQKCDILLVQIYVDDIIFGSTNKDLCKSIEKLMKGKFHMSLIRELTFFLGLQVKQKKDGIFISQDKYMAEILRKFRLTDGKLAITPIDKDKPLLKDPDGEDVNVHIYRSMIGSLMYLTSSRPDIMFVCMSAKRTSWNEFSSSMASAVICLSSGRKLIFSTYIFDSLVRNVDSPSKFYMYPRFLQLIIRKQVGDLSTHITKYTSPTLTQKAFANMRRVGTGFFGVGTPLFEGMLLAQKVEEENANENVENVNVGDTAEGDVSATHDEVPTADKEPSIPSPTPHTPPPQPSHYIPSTSQLQPTPPHVQPQSPQPQPQQDVGIPMYILQEVIDTCIALTRRIKRMELDKISQALEMTRLKRKVNKLERRNKGRVFSDMDADADVVLEEAKEVVDDAKDDQDAKEDESSPAEVQEVVDVVCNTPKLGRSGISGPGRVTS
nr:putative ribonuclease H-like domain-containing protein [Tanacetum cinerariifolium]